MNKANNEIPIESHETFSPTFMAVVLHIYGGKGHVLSYHKAVGEAVRLNGWSHLAVVSPDPALTEFPREWNVEHVDSGVLDYEGTEIKRLLKRLNFWAFIKSTYILAHDFTNVLRKELESRPNRKIILLESFNPLQLLSVILSLLFVKRDRLSVWLMYRGGPDWGGRKHRLMAKSFATLFRAMNPIIRLLVGGNNLMLLTDSEILSASLPKYYKKPVYLVPIPHTPVNHGVYTEKEESHEHVVCWWPGAPREDKGMGVIRRLASLKDRDAYKVTLVAAKSANLIAQADCIKITAVDDKLDRQDYERRFFISDVVLLPYDRDIYSESTSGIFVECIVAGAIPLVTKDTWMAYELEKRDLGELVIDWGSDFLVQQIIDLATNRSIKQKIRTMQLEYRSFHSIPSFAQAIHSLYTRPPSS
mgnify:CR=1 FL=1